MGRNFFTKYVILISVPMDYHLSVLWDQNSPPIKRRTLTAVKKQRLGYIRARAGFHFHFWSLPWP